MTIPSGKLPGVISPQEQFARISNPKISRSTFDRSHGYKTTIDAGSLYPIFFDEALPGDTMNLRSNIFGRMSTPLTPIMDNLYIDVHYFSVPCRLIYDNWEKLNGAQDNPADSTDFLTPQVTVPTTTGYGELSLADYFGIPTKVDGFTHSAFWFRAYNLIWNEWYRDENLQDSVTVNKDNGPDAATDYAILPRGKRKDYFTSSLPWAQKADPVSIPLGTSAPIYGANMDFDGVDDNNNRAQVLDAPGGNLRGLSTAANILYGTNTDYGTGQLLADLTNATAATINSLRDAFRLQELYERDARGGTRYTEILHAHFGVTSPDARLQRPEYLGGGSRPITTLPVAQTSESNVTPQGSLTGTTYFEHSGDGFVKSFTEHEVVIGLASIRADLNYQQGLNRMWSRSTRFDYYWPSFANLGEQAVLNKEIYTQGTAADDDVFGYQERYAEMRYKPSVVTGLFRSNATASLDIWHLAQDFGALPGLNDTFIVEQPPISRVVATPSEPEFIIDAYFDFKHARPLPTYATPGMAGIL